jgi:6-phosphofructokinase
VTQQNGNLLVLQGGGPTPVVNTSLYGVLDEARTSGRFDQLLGARFGTQGLINDDLVDLTPLPQRDLDRLKFTPGASLGTTRHKPSDAELESVLAVLRRRDVRHLFLIGGNGSLRGAEVIDRAARHAGYDLRVIGVPKTVDNDIPTTDRCPGFGSAANYLAQSVRDLGTDVRALLQPVSIYETMGRSVGWLAAAAALAKDPDDDASAPHLIYLPERPFDTDRFLASVDRAVTRHGHCVAVVAEGLKRPDGRPVYETSDPSQADALGRALPGGVASHLADVVTQRLKIRCRSEKPGLCGRASIRHLSQQDSADAELVGRAAVRATLDGRSGEMVSLTPLTEPGPGYVMIPLSAAAGERHIPPQWLADTDLAVNEAFLQYARGCAGKLLHYPKPLKD